MKITQAENSNTLQNHVKIPKKIKLHEHIYCRVIVWVCMDCRGVAVTVSTSVSISAH